MHSPHVVTRPCQPFVALVGGLRPSRLLGQAIRLAARERSRPRRRGWRWHAENGGERRIGGLSFCFGLRKVPKGQQRGKSSAPK